MTFSPPPRHSSTLNDSAAAALGAEKPVIPKFNPKVPPPTYKPFSQKSTSTDASGEIQKRVIVESIGSDTGSVPQQIGLEDLELFRSRLETHIHEFNKLLDKKLNMPARHTIPWIERGKIVVVPADYTTGQLIIDLVNKKELVLKSHILRAGWNRNLPEVAVISIGYDLTSKRQPITLIKDDHNGIARMNGWDVERHEISYLNVNPCKKNKNVSFVRATVSKKVIGLIQQQRGQIWVSGGQATIFWNNKLLDASNDVQFNFQ